RSGRLLTIESRRGALRQPLDAVSRWLQHLAWRGAIERAYRILCAGASSRNVGVAIDLIASAPQAGHAIAIYVALPRQELIDGDVVVAARFFDWHPAASYCFVTTAFRRAAQRSRGDGSAGSRPRACANRP